MMLMVLVLPASRYSIALKHASPNTYRTLLVWKLELPKEPGEVQKDLAIGQEGSLALSIKVSGFRVWKINPPPHTHPYVPSSFCPSPFAS